MKHTRTVFSVLVLFSIASTDVVASDRSAAERLCNEAIKGLEELRSQDGKNVESTKNSDNKWNLVFQKLEQALRLDPEYGRARTNLMIAHNNFALHLCSENKQRESMMEFHKSLYIQDDLTTRGNLDELIRRAFGKDPNRFQDRVEFGDNALRENDLTGAFIEYRAALHLKEDRVIRKKFNETKERLAEQNRHSSE